MLNIAPAFSLLLSNLRALSACCALLLVRDAESSSLSHCFSFQVPSTVVRHGYIAQLCLCLHSRAFFSLSFALISLCSAHLFAHLLTRETLELRDYVHL